MLALAIDGTVPGAGKARPIGVATADWLYIVKSKSTDPTREADYNRWYTDIDIPDVLAVPGFKRARRAVASDRSSPPTPAYAADGDYVAIYDIQSPDIDKTIIDLYVGARRMTWRGRTTDLLKVTEANYYRSVWDERANGADQAANPYVRLVKINCCKTVAERIRLETAVRASASREMAHDRRISRVALYDLYRVMEVEALPPSEVPHLMLLIESGAPNAENAWLSAALPRSLVADDSRDYSVFNTQQASHPQ